MKSKEEVTDKATETRLVWICIVGRYQGMLVRNIMEENVG
jgi:hypothetical protein